MKEGPFTLALSSAFFGFYAHIGFAEALFEAGHAPAKYTGASAGAIIGAALASGLTPVQARDVLFKIRREDFWDPGFGPGLLRGKKFREQIAKVVAPTFAQTQVPLEISVFDVFALRTQFLYQGDIARAVVASCAVPGMFHPVRIGGRFYLDGGLRNKSGIQSEDERVLCVYLESAGAAGWYERKTTFPQLKSGHKVVRFTEFPRVSYDSMDRGPEAHQNILQRTRLALEVPFEGNFLDA